MSPAGETDTLSTPERANAQAHGASKIKSTPNSRGAAVVSENISLVGVKVKEIRPWIERDIEQAKQCKADAMLEALLQRASCTPKIEQSELLQDCLKAVLPVCNGQFSAKGISSLGIKTALKKYVRPGLESGFYSPFIEATNIALACLEKIKVAGMGEPVSAVDMICQHNDAFMYQNHQGVRSSRKPDGVILPFNSAYAAFEDEQDGKQDKQKKDGAKRKAHMAKNAMEKPTVPLRWEDVLACIEFKRKPGKRQGIKPAPPSYKVKDYVPTKPEHLPVEYLNDDDLAPVPSETQETQSAPDNTSAGPSSGLSAAQPSKGGSNSQAAGSSSGLTAAQPPKGGSDSKRKAEDALESATKKPKIKPDEPDVTVQTGLYAAEMFAANLAVNNLLNLIVVDDVIWIWYYDRQGTIQSSGINFIQDLPRFMVLMYALQRFQVEDWGRNKDFLPVQVDGKQCHEFKVQDAELGEVDLLLHTSHDERVTHYGLQGRATNVVPVTSEALTKKYGNFPDGMVAKIFWGEASRTSEPEILKKVKEIAKKHAAVQGHIPELLWHHTFTEPTSTIRQALGVPDPTKGSRVLYILIFRKLLPITALHEKEFFDVWYQCILCHITLWKEGVYHRDISPPNMMWYWKNGKRIGVLNDYDLSSLADDPCPRGNERTGTVPFMALDLLSPKAQRGEVKHLYRHDLESFIWVFIWICFSYSAGKSARLRPLDQWATLDAVTCGKEKYFFLGNLLDCPSHLHPIVWRFLVQCVLVLKNDVNRRADLRLAKLLMGPGVAEESDDEEPEDMDGFLRMFTNTKAWVELSEFSNAPQ